jgi:hypothetical protein
MTITELGIQAKREYARQWREKNRETIRQKKRDWDRLNQDKVRLYQNRYWEKKAAELLKAQ